MAVAAVLWRGLDGPGYDGCRLLGSATAWALELLPPRCERRSETTHWSEAPSVGYAALVAVAPTGFIRLYRGL